MNAVAQMTPHEAVTPMTMLEKALAGNVSPETLERLMDLQERWVNNQAKAAYMEAMALVQAEARPVATDASNPQTKSRYASYHALDGALRPLYTKHGFSISFNTAETTESTIMIVAIVGHRSGHVQTFQAPMPNDGKGAKGGDVMTKTHATGAAITYGRRYLLGMIFNISIGEDTDGNARDKLIEGSATISADEFIFIRELIETSGAVEETVLKAVGASSLEILTQKQYREACSRIQTWVKTRAKTKPPTLEASANV